MQKKKQQPQQQQKTTKIYAKSIYWLPIEILQAFISFFIVSTLQRLIFRATWKHNWISLFIYFVAVFAVVVDFFFFRKFFSNLFPCCVCPITKHSPILNKWKCCAHTQRIAYTSHIPNKYIYNTSLPERILLALNLHPLCLFASDRFNWTRSNILQ